MYLVTLLPAVYSGGREVLYQCAAKGHVQHLHTAAYAKNRPAVEGID